MRSTLAAFFLLLAGSHLQAQYVLLTLSQLWKSLDIVAVIKVGPVSEVSTPQGLVLQSATAEIEQLIYRRSPPAEGESLNQITIYSLLPNGLNAACPAPLTLASGRAFIMMQQNGVHKFYPTNPWEFQVLSGNTILWPTKSGIKKRLLSDVIPEITAYARSHPKD